MAAASAAARSGSRRGPIWAVSIASRGRRRLPPASTSRRVDRDVDAPLELVVLVVQVAGGDALQRRLQVPEQQRLPLVDGQAQRRVQRLQVEAAVVEAGRADLLLEAAGDVDELGRPRGR